MCETSDREYITANKIREFDRKRGKIGNGERDRCRRPEFAEKSISYLVFFFPSILLLLASNSTVLS